MTVNRLDPRSRNGLWAVIRELVAEGPCSVAPLLGSVAWIAGLTLVFAPPAISRYRRLA